MDTVRPVEDMIAIFPRFSLFGQPVATILLVAKSCFNLIRREIVFVKSFSIGVFSETKFHLLLRALN